MRRFSMFTVAFGLALAPLVLNAAPALASCAPPVPLDQALADAPTVFVGTVVELRFDDRFAVFDVEDVWKGDLPDRIEVNGGPALADLESLDKGTYMSTSVDRTYRLGERYVVVSYGLDQTALTDNVCSATQEYTDHLTQFRPADAHPPTPTQMPGPADPDEPDDAHDPATTADGGSGARWGFAAAALLGAGGVGAIVVRRRDN